MSHTCQFEPVGVTQLTQTCQQDAGFRVEYRFDLADPTARSRRRYCRLHAERVAGFLQQAGIEAHVVEAE